ncbi:hypothetical protein [Anthocerotibacter panamensis]|uniref:hypothetical protein n=1 Tax=Anthocerotibacter panamensis TaxID=2857077 RepID=UPI001C40489B|nr:hypothetical protein [Anthocerotibacter panamensis]
MVQDVGGFVTGSLDAKSTADLDRAAEHLARAIATVGVDTVIAVLMHKAGNAAKDRLPGQPEMVTPEGMRVRVPEAEHHTKPLAIEAKQGSSSAEAIKQRMRELDAQGHGPARHGPHLTKEQLKDRALKGHDPVTGTTDDAYKKFPDGTPKKHLFGRHATKVTSIEAYVKAEEYIRKSQLFKDKVAAAYIANEDTIVIKVTLEEIFGRDYQTKVYGETRLGSASKPAGLEETDFTNGVMKAVYDRDISGKWDLTTMYPEPQ